MSFTATATIRTATVTGTWATPATWGGTAPVAGDSCVIPLGITVTVGASTTVGAVNVIGGLTITTNGVILTVTGGSGTPLTYGTVGGTGTITAANTGGTTNTITLTSGDWIFSGAFVGSRLTVRMTGTADDQTISGALSCRVFVMVKSTTTLHFAITPTVSTTRTLTSGNVVYDGAAQDILVATHPGSVTLSGSGTKTTVGVTTTTGDLIINDGITLSVGAFNLTVNGTTTIGGGTSGNLTFASATGTKQFTGLVTVNSGATWNNAINEAVNFRGGITNNGGTFTSGTGAYTFTTNVQELNGTFSIPTATFSIASTNNGTLTSATLLSVVGVVLTNNGTINSSTSITNTGTLSNSSSGIVNITGGSCSITTLTNAGTVTISGTATTSTVPASFTNSGTININGSGNIAGMTNSGTINMNGTSAITTSITNTGTVNLSSSGVISSFTNSTAGLLNISAAPVPTITLTATAAGNTVKYSGAAQTVNATTYDNLTLSGTGAKTTTGITVNNVLSIEGNATVTVSAAPTYGAAATIRYHKGAAFTAGAEWPNPFAGTGGVIIDSTGTIITTNGIKNISGGPLTINAGTTLATGANNLWTLTVAGATTVNGTITLANTGTKTFTGDVTINSGGIWNETGAAAMNFAGNLQHDGSTFTALTGVHTFSGTGKTIGGVSAIAIPSLTISGTTTNNGTLTVSTTLAGASTFTNSATGTLNFGGASITPTLNANQTGNIVNYNSAGAQTVKAAAYSNLIFSGGGAKSMSALTSVADTLSIAPTGSATASIGAGLVLDVHKLVLGGVLQVDGTWGSTGSIATNTNNTYFAISTGYLSVNIPITSTTTGGAWGSGTTWVGGIVPTSTNNVVIATTGGNSVTAAAVTIAGLTVNSGAILDLGTSTLMVTGSVINDGTITGTTGQLRQTGSGSFTNSGSFTLSGAGRIDFSGNFTNTGTFSLASSQVRLVGTGAGPYNVDGFTTTGALNITSATGTYTFTGNVNVNGIACSGSGSTLNLGTGLTHTSTAVVAISAGATLEGGSSTLNLDVTGAAFTNVGTFTAATGTINYGFAGPQTVLATPYYNLSLSGSGAKTLTGVTTIANDFSMSGASTGTSVFTTIAGNVTLTGTANLTTGAALAISGNLDVGSGTSFATGVTNTWTLGVTGTTSVTGTLTLANTGAKTFTGDVTLNSGGVWNETGAAPINFAGSFTNNATTFTANTGVHTFSGATKTISGTLATTIGSVAVTGTYTNNNTLTIGTALSGVGTLTNSATGTLDLGGTCSITTLDNAGIINRTGAGTTTTTLINFTNTGTINISGSGTITGITNNDGGIVNHSGSSTITSFNNATATSTLNISTTPTVPTFTTLTVSAAGNTVNYNGAGPQTVKAVAYSNLIFSGSGAKSMLTGTSVSGDLSIAPSGTATASVGAGLNLDVKFLTLGGVLQADGTWGSTSSTAVHTNDTYFAATTGILSVNIPITSTATGGAWGTGTTWIGGVVPTTTDNVVIATTGGNSVTAAAATVASLTVNSGAILNLAAVTITVSGLVDNAGTISGTTGQINQTGSADFTNSGSFTLTGAGRVSFSGSFTNTGTFSLASSQVRLVGTAAGPYSIDGFTTTGAFSVPSTKGTYIFAGNVNVNGIACSGSGSTLNLGAGLTHTSTGVVSISAGATLEGGSSTLHINRTGTAFTNAGTFTAETGTIDYGYAGSQTALVTTYYNLTFSGTGTKTLPAGTTTVNNIFSIENDAFVNNFVGTLAYGSNATLQYNTSVARTASDEWVSPFAATGGVIISNIGEVTMNADKIFNASVPLTINSGASLNTSASNFALTFGGNFVNNGGTFTANASAITIDNTMATQSIAGFTTTGTVSITKTSGTATFNGNVNGGAFTLDGTGGTLDLGTGLTHTFTGTFTSTAGTLNLSSSTLNIGGLTSGSGGTWNPGTSTVNYNRATGGQSIFGVNYYNLTSSNSSGVNTLVGSIGVSNIFTPSAGALTSAGTSTVDFNNSTGGQSIPAFNYYNLTSSNASGVNTLIGSIGVSNIFTPSAGALTSAGTSTVDFNNSTGGQSIPAFNYYNLTSSNTSGVNTLVGSIGVSNIFTPSAGALTSAGTSTVDFNNSTGGQSIPAFNYYSVTSSNTSGVNTLIGSIGVSNTFSPSAGALTSAGTSTVNFNNAAGSQTIPAFNFNNVTVSNSSGTTTLAGSGTIGIAGIFTPGSQAYSSAGSTVNFNNSTGGQTIPAINYNNLTVSNTSGTTTLASSGTIGIAGTFTPGSQAYTVTSSAISFNGSTGQSLASAFTFNNLTMNNASGVTLSGIATVNGTLTLTSGNITTGAHKVSIGTSGTISGSGGYIVGNLEKTISTSGSPVAVTFEVGDASYYTPINLTFASVSGSGTLTANTTSSYHPQINTSGISTTKHVTRYWTLTNNAVTFPSVDATFNFNTADVVLGSNTSLFIVGRYNSGWTLPTVGTKTSNSTQATGLTAFGDFQVGEVATGVTLTPATGGSSVSADDFGTGAWTSLTGPSIEETVNGDIGLGTIILDVPSGFEFDQSGTAPTVLITGGGTATDNINNATSGTSASVSVSATQITFTVTDVSTGGALNTLTWQNIRIRPTAGYPLATGNITKSGGSFIVGVTDGTTNFGTLTEVRGALSKLVVTLPGETFTEGSGNSGPPTNRTAGSSFTISSITATDQYFNTVTSYSGAKTISYSGPTGQTSYTTSVTFISGVSSTALTTTLYRAQSSTITANDGTYSGPASSSVTVDPAAFSKMQLLVPGESANPGSTGTGKTGSPSAQTAGASFGVTVNAVDAYWNVIAGAPTNTITLTTTDANATMPSPAALSSGTVTFATVTLPTAGSSTITATNTSDVSKTADTSPSITVNAGAFTKMQILVPGETANAGSATGKTGTPSSQTAGSSFSVTVNAVDANWNIVSGAPANTITLTTSDVNATMPSPAALSSGTVTFATVTLPTAGSSTITATNTSDGTKTANTSPSISVGVGAFSKMQTLVPGETADPGSATGKTGIPLSQTAGSSFSVTVNAVDANWNIITSAPANTITLTTSDVNASMPSPAALSSGTVTFATVTLPTATSSTITATNTSDGTKTANTSSSITVNAGTLNKLQVIVDGETAVPGSVAGKMGTPVAAGIGTPFVFTVNAVDANWNIVNATNTITITSTDGAATLPPDAALVGGTKDFTLTLNTAGVWTITASNVGGPPPTAGTSASITAASITITPATGGGSISADDSTSGAWTALTGPLYGEAASANVGTGTIIMNAPSGFIFDVGGIAPTVLVTRIAGAGANSRNINAVASGTSLAITSISTTQITFTVSSSSNTGVTNSLTWQNVRVRPNISYPLASGNITKSGTASMVGVTNGVTNFGTLTEILGAPKTWSGLGDGTSWNDAANWSPAGVPTGANDVTIGANTINVNVAALAHDITINNASASVTIPTGISLSATNNYAQSNGTLNTATIFPAVTGTTSITGGTVNYNSTGSQNVAAITYSNLTISGNGTSTLLGTVSINGDLTVSGGTLDLTSFTADRSISGGALTIAASCTLRIGGTGTIPANYTSQVFDPTSTIDFYGTTQTIPAGTYPNVTASNSGGSVTLGGNIIVVGDLNISCSTFDLTSFTANRSAAGGTLTIAALCTLRIGGTGTSLPINYTTHAFDPTSHIDYYGTGQTVPAGTYDNLIVSGAGTTITLSANVDVVGNLTVSDGTLDLSTFTANRTTSGGTLSVGSGGTLRISGTNAIPASYTTYTFDPASTVEFYGTSQSIAALNYGNLTVSASGTITLANTGTIGIAGTFTKGAATYVTTGSTIDYNGTGAQSIAAFSYNNLSLSTGGIKTFAGGTTQIAGALTITGATANATANSSTIEYNGTLAQAVTVMTYFDLVFTNGGLKTIAGSVIVNTNVLINSGASVLISAPGILTVHGDVDNSGSFTIDGTLDVTP